VHSKSGRDLPPHRPKKIFNRDSVVELRARGFSLRKIAERLGIGLGTVVRSLQERSKNPQRVLGTLAWDAEKQLGTLVGAV